VSSTQRNRPRTLTRLAAAFVTFFTASVAFAQAFVVVEVRTPEGGVADGVLTLMHQQNGTTYACTTHEGTCRIEGVPGGLYMAILRLNQGPPPPTRQVMIPPSGSVTLRVSTR
jgi:hypothetical protein